jgi:ATP-dependent helicase HrpA
VNDTAPEPPPARTAFLRRVPDYPDNLPIAQYRSAILEAIRRHPTVIVAGETGSGKTTQLPKMLIEAGCVRQGRVAVTQPRRLAATSVAQRVAEEMGDPAARFVGHHVRFDNQTGADTVVTFMTDGIMLAETRTDRMLQRYDAIMIDEVHERSLNIDFLLGYLKRLLHRRPDLKLLISSATLDVVRFATFFDGAPVVEVPGRLYPVETRYREPEDPDSDLADEVAAVVDQLTTEQPRADILVFLSGEASIRETERLLAGRGYRQTEIIPLYGRLPAAEQRRAFAVGGRRRIILSTNVAETSVTLPGIRVVIDSGLARIKRYNPRTQVEKLHVEPISRASAEQRKGRCGRIAPGVCIRLYSSGDLASRPEFNDPEIKRSSLASVILTMMDLTLGRVDTFPFLDPPSPAAIKDGYRELKELEAIDAHRRLTPLGRQMARFSVEPRSARMLIEAHRRRVLPDILTVVSALETDDPRLRPAGHEDEADRAHASFSGKTSDFATLLRLWHAIDTAAGSHASRRFRAYCQEHFLSYRRVREWQAVRKHIAEACCRAGMSPDAGSSVNDETLHRSLLPGLLAKLGVRQERHSYRGGRGITFFIHPGSSLRNTPPQWVVAAELVETSRLFARYVAAVKPEWVESAAHHLCRYRYGQPYWDETTGFVRAEETVLLYGLPLASGRRRHYGPINPCVSRSIFIQHALVEGRMAAPPEVIRDNLRTLAEATAMEHRLRRRDLVIGESARFAFYDARLPRDIYSVRDFKQWLAEEPDSYKLLRLKADDLLLSEPDLNTLEDAPEQLHCNGIDLPLKYTYEPGSARDGATCMLTVAELQQITPTVADWIVPALLRQKMHALLRGLPKRYRRELVPLDRTVERMLRELEPGCKRLINAMDDWILRHCSHRVPAEDWPTDLPACLNLHVEVYDSDGKLLDSGDDVEQLKSRFARQARETADQQRAHTAAWSREGIRQWDFNSLLDSVEVGTTGWSVLHYPGIQDAGESVCLRLFPTSHAARRTSAIGLARLAMLALPREARQARSVTELSASARLTLGMIGHQPLSADALVLYAIADACGFFESLPRDRGAFVDRIHAGTHMFYTRTRAITALVEAAMETVSGVLAGLESLAEGPLHHAAVDMHDQLAGLFGPAFPHATAPAALNHYPRFLQAMQVRIRRLLESPAKDAEKFGMLTPYLDRLTPYREQLPCSAELEQYRWMLEEWRVSLFAQEIRTHIKVSPKRLDTQWEKALADIHAA